ncbi:MAG: NADH-quinone oxidoreductase subunit M [Candidatus Dormibacteraeota bacterium]|nr:NADH-quinone oxidoreductase subunit M [Candidatus Dormibacteraeota bacterium]
MTGLQLPSLFLTVVVFLAFAGFIVVSLMPERNDEDRSRIRLVGLGASGLTLILVLIFGMYGQIALGQGGGQATAGEENHRWFTFSFMSQYHLTADGVSLVLLLVSGLVFTSVFFHSWKQHDRVKLYVGMLLLLETSVNGVLCSADHVLFLLFWGMQIAPLYVLIRVYGGVDRLRAATRYLSFALLSFALIATAAVLIILKGGQQTSDITLDYANLLAPVQTAGYWLSLTGFAIAMGVFPLHRWMVDSHAEASAGVAAVASGLLLPLGAYGILRITLPTFPTASAGFAVVLAGLAVVGALWGAVAALAQDDLRRFLAYVNLAQMSAVLLGLAVQTSVALVGVVFLLVAHGLAMTMLTLMAGTIEERTRTRSLSQLGGLAAQAPRLAGFWIFAVLTAVGIPLLAGFIGQFLLLAGAFPIHRIATVVVLASTLITTAGFAWIAHRVFFGPARETFTRVRDATAVELAFLLPLVAFVLLFGIRPGAVTPMVTNGILDITTRLVGG